MKVSKMFIPFIF